MESSLIIKKSEIANLIKFILSDGIDLEIKGKIQELSFLIKLHRFINNRSKLRSYIEETRVTIETLWFDPLLIVEVENGIMSVIPITDEGFYDALGEILHFFYLMQEKKKPKKKAPKPPSPKTIPSDDWYPPGQSKTTTPRSRHRKQWPWC